MIRVITIMIFIFAAQHATAADCKLSTLGINKPASELIKKYDLNNDHTGQQNYIKNTRGKALCKELGDAEVSLFFISDSLAQVEILKHSDKTYVLDQAINAFGAPDTQPNAADPEIRGYSTFWNDKDAVTTYSYSYAHDKKLYLERLTVQSHKLAAELAKFGQENSDEGR